MQAAKERCNAQLLQQLIIVHSTTQTGVGLQQHIRPEGARWSQLEAGLLVAAISQGTYKRH